MSEKPGSGERPEEQPSASTGSPGPATPPPAAPPAAGQPPYPGQPPYYGQPAPPARRRLPGWITSGRTLIAAAALVLALLVGATGFAIGRATADDHHGGPGVSDSGGWRQRGPGYGRHGNGQLPQGPQGGQLPGQGTAWLPGTGSPESSTTRSREQVA